MAESKIPKTPGEMLAEARERQGLSLEAYCRASHVLVSGDGTMSGIADEALARRGRSRMVCLAVPSFLAALSILADSDFIATLPASLVRMHADRFDLAHGPAPIEIRPFDVSLLSHRRNRKSPFHTWCGNRIRDA